MNLINNQVGFVLVDLSPEFQSEQNIDKFKGMAKACAPKQAPEKVLEWVIDKSHPVVLLHKKERVANKVFHKLVENELVNVYVVEGGWPRVEEFASGVNTDF